MNHCCHGSCGIFLLGMAAGAVAGAALGMGMNTSPKKVKRAARAAAKRMSEAVENMAQAMDM